MMIFLDCKLQWPYSLVVVPLVAKVGLNFSSGNESNLVSKLFHWSVFDQNLQPPTNIYSPQCHHLLYLTNALLLFNWDLWKVISFVTSRIWSVREGTGEMRNSYPTMYQTASISWCLVKERFLSKNGAWWHYPMMPFQDIPSQSRAMIMKKSPQCRNVNISNFVLDHYWIIQTILFESYRPGH